MSRNGSAFGLQTAYVCLLGAMIPISAALIWSADILDFLGDGTMGLLNIWAFVYCAAVFILGAVNISRAFRPSDERGCAISLLILKFGTAAVFALEFIVSAVMLMIVNGGASSGGSALNAGVLMLALLLTALMWLLMLPGAFWGLRAVRICRESGKIGSAGFLLHSLLQFVFIADLIDAVYLKLRLQGAAK